MCFLEQKCYLLVSEASYATADTGHKKRQFLMGFRKLNELIHVGFDGLYTALHRGNAITLSLQANALSHNGTKLAVGCPCCATTVHTLQITAKHENLIRLELCNPLGGCSLLFHIII